MYTCMLSIRSFSGKQFCCVCVCVCVFVPIFQAVRSSIYGRPGPTYIEIPGNMVTDTVPEESIM